MPQAYQDRHIAGKGEVSHHLLIVDFVSKCLPRFDRIQTQVKGHLMADASVNSIVEQVKSLSLDEQMQVAEEIDRLTWIQRWRRICEQLESRMRGRAVITDDQIDAAVRVAREETPLSERSSIQRRTL